MKNIEATHVHMNILYCTISCSIKSNGGLIFVFFFRQTIGLLKGYWMLTEYQESKTQAQGQPNNLVSKPIEHLS
jgi:hypothetical protein